MTSRRRSKHRLFWKDLLSIHSRKAANHQDHVPQTPILSTITTPSLSHDTNQAQHTLVRSNARAKSPRNSQTRKTARTDNPSSISKRKDRHADLASKTPFGPRTTMTHPDTKMHLPSPPPYVLSLPEAVVTPPSLVALTNDELRSRGIYSPHPAMDQGSTYIEPGMPRTSMSRNTSLRSALSMFAPRLGIRPVTSSGNLLSRSQRHARNHSSPLASTFLAIGVCISVLMVSLDRGSITTTIPSLLTNFRSPKDMGWYGSAYLLTVSAFQPMYGRVYASFNIKWSFLGAVSIFQVGALICATAPISEVFILGRAVQGLGSAGVSTGSFAIIIHSFDPKGRPALLAFLDAVSWSGTIAGPVIGGAFAQLLSWKCCYYLNLMLAGVTYACVLLCSRARQSRVPRPNLIRQTSDFSSTSKTFARRVLALDWIGSFLFMAASTFLFLALQLSQQREFDQSSSPWIIFASLSVTILLVFVLWMQIRGDNALIPFHILRQRTVATSCAAAFFLYGAFIIHVYYLPIWFQALKKQSAIESGVSMVPYTLIMAVFSLVSGRFVSGNGRFAPFAMLGCGTATIGAGLTVILDPDTSILACAGYQMVIAAGLGVATQKSLSAVRAVLPLHEESIGTAIAVAFQNAGSAVFVSIVSTLFQKYLLRDGTSAVDLQTPTELDLTDFAALFPHQPHSESQRLYVDAFRVVFITAIPLCGIAFLFSMCVGWNIVQHDQVSRIPGLMNMQGINRGFNSPELGSDAPTLAHLAPRARHRWSQRWSVPITDLEVGQRRLSTVLQESNVSETSLLSIEDVTSADVKEMEIGIAIST